MVNIYLHTSQMWLINMYISCIPIVNVPKTLLTKQSVIRSARTTQSGTHKLLVCYRPQNFSTLDLSQQEMLVSSAALVRHAEVSSCMYTTFVIFQKNSFHTAHLSLDVGIRSGFKQFLDDDGVTALGGTDQSCKSFL